MFVIISNNVHFCHFRHFSYVYYVKGFDNIPPLVNKKGDKNEKKNMTIFVGDINFKEDTSNTPKCFMT